jgi:hypothetical protein
MPFSKTALGSPRQNWRVSRTGKSTNQATEATRKAASLLQIDFLIVLKCPFPEATPLFIFDAGCGGQGRIATDA